MRQKHTESSLAKLTAHSRRWGALVKHSRAARMNLRTIGVFSPYVPDESDIAMEQTIRRGSWSYAEERSRSCYSVEHAELERVPPPPDVLLRVDFVEEIER
jgi:hypothetical protein